MLSLKPAACLNASRFWALRRVAGRNVAACCNDVLSVPFNSLLRNRAASSSRLTAWVTSWVCIN